MKRRKHAGETTPASGPALSDRLGAAGIGHRRRRSVLLPGGFGRRGGWGVAWGSRKSPGSPARGVAGALPRADVPAGLVGARRQRPSLAGDLVDAGDLAGGAVDIEDVPAERIAARWVSRAGPLSQHFAVGVAQEDRNIPRRGLVSELDPVLVDAGQELADRRNLGTRTPPSCSTQAKGRRRSRSSSYRDGSPSKCRGKGRCFLFRRARRGRCRGPFRRSTAPRW